MNIDFTNEKNLLITTDKDNLIKAINYFKLSTQVKYKQVFFDLSRSISISDTDLELVIHFLLKFKFFDFNDDLIKKKKDFDVNDIFEEFSAYYFKILQVNHDINFNLFLNSEYSIDNDSIIINVNSVKMGYRPFFISLQKLGFLIKSKQNNFVIINNYQFAKKILERPLRKISQLEFEKELEQKKVRGFLAEEFVLLIENQKLKSKKLYAKRVSIDDIGLGYDIVSYLDVDNEIFIEVKTLMYGNSFFWTKNEIKSAKLYSENYFIYCVLFDNKNNPLEIKKIIQNPYLKIFTNKEYIKESTGDFLIKI